ncbi:Sugar phosphate permease [Pelosinus fermentans]|uniref:Major facilitator superfamily MFS_1 n=1 Tax=Pelosinus fermentans B4 TaxID=1149862 RepID=I8RIH9_9FIRM|nr:MULTISPECIES: MFS transporter [Pelosinus]EIW19693.1 major facilitator superfamily MFS_1 [Pelosinus fermentans B4]OAM93012.1 major facilitator superfamily MFS_1 [Pelosinus fermentans DSM 17108]SDQ64053.1 Sugar phosphate permease [Pelosinus fermentans]
MTLAEKNATAAKKTMGKMTNYRWWVMMFIFVIYTVANADRANIGFALPYIREEFAMSNTEAGALISLFFIGYSLGQIPSGFLTSRFGIRKMFTAGMFLTSAFTGMMGVVDSAFHLKILRTMVGLAESPVVIGCTATINNWFPAKEKGTATGIFLAGSKVGPLIVPPLCAWIIMTFGWREIFLFFMIPGVLLSIFWYLMVRSQPGESKFVSASELQYIQTEETAVAKAERNKEYKLWWLDKIVRAKKVIPLNSSKQVFRSWDIYGAALGYFFIIGISSIMMSWLPTYLVTIKKFAIMKTAFVAASPFAGTVVGNFLGGWLSDKYLNKRRKPLMMVTAFSASLMMYSLVHAPNDPVLLAMLLFITGVFFSLGYSAFACYPMGRVDKENYPIAWGIVNTGGQLGGACFPLIVGIILDKFSWNAVFVSMAVGSMICLLIVSTIVEPVEDPLERPFR